jgi:tyrosine-protein phosphatase SIW14
MSRRSIIVVLATVPASLWAASPDTGAQGVPNFHQVGDHIYRGAQPSKHGIENLAKLGVKTVIDLRGGADHSATSRSWSSPRE